VDAKIQAAVARRVSISWLCSGGPGAWVLWRPESASRIFVSATKLLLFACALSIRSRLAVRTVDLSLWFSTRQVYAQEGNVLQRPPTWRYRVLKTALRLRPRRALSSASGQKPYIARKPSAGKAKNRFGLPGLRALKIAPRPWIPTTNWPKSPTRLGEEAFFQPSILFDERQENHLQFQLPAGHFHFISEDEPR